MDDLGNAIQSFLSQPGAMDELKEMAQQLGIGTPEPQQESTLERLSPETMSRVMSALSEVSRPDESTVFLEALKPLLRQEKQDKLDQAIKALRMMRAARSVSGMVEL